MVLQAKEAAERVGESLGKLREAVAKRLEAVGAKSAPIWKDPDRSHHTPEPKRDDVGNVTWRRRIS